MKKLLLGFLMSLMIFGLVGCFGDDDDDKSITSLTVSSEAVKVLVGENLQLTAEVIYDDGSTSSDVTWSTESTNVTLTADGKVTGVSTGMAVIKATKDSKMGTLEIEVYEDSEPAVIIPAVKDGFMRMHLVTDDESRLDGLRIHYWSDAVTDTSWPGEEVTLRDEYGAYIDIPIANYGARFGMIFHANVEPRPIEMEIGQDRPVFTMSNGENITESWFNIDVDVQYLDSDFTMQPIPAAGIENAEIQNKRVVEIELSSAITVSPANIYMKDQDNNVITASYVEYVNDMLIKLHFAEDLDYGNSYTLAFVSNPSEAINEDDLAFVAPGLAQEILNSDDFTYTGDDLGATLNGDGSAVLKVWSPFASSVSVYVYDKADQTKEVAGPVALTKDDLGVWSVTLDSSNTSISDLDRYFYQYEVTAQGATKKALDPYAKSMAAFNAFENIGGDNVGKAAFVDTDSADAGVKPIAVGNTELANPVDMVVYEIHVRDFTIGADVEDKGTFMGWVNYQEGIDHLKELGVTHVQLLPIHNYYTVDENNKDFMEVGNEGQTNYNWGYDPHNFFTPEGWFSTDASDPYSRIKEFRTLVNKLHDNGIGVIMDVVYNHTYNMEVFENVAPGLYHRPVGGTTPVSNPAVASERPMVRKLIIDSLKYFVDEYGIDGYRFDLMGFIDTETMLEARAELGENIILHGEAWAYTDLYNSSTREFVFDGITAPIKGVTDYSDHGIADLAFFNDTARRAFKGDTGDNQDTSLGFVQGQYSSNAVAKAAIIAGLKDFPQSINGDGELFANIDDDDYNIFTTNPDEVLQYQSIHDGFTLWDKINITVEGTLEEKMDAMKQSVAMQMTSQGKIIMLGGEEIARTKPITTGDPEPSRTNEFEEYALDEGFGTVFHENSYKSPDYTNMLRWDRKEETEIKEFYDYFSGLISLRRNVPALRYASADNVKAGLRFIGETKPTSGTEGTLAGYTSFTEVETFSINFKNAPEASRGTTLYLAGESTPGCIGGENDGNSPDMDMHSVEIDADGNGVLTFTKEDIDAFALGAWGATEDLNFKLVDEPGAWNSPSGSYTTSGNNRIAAKAILDDNTVVIDLSVTDHQATGSVVIEDPESFIAYTLDNTIDTALGDGVAGTDYVTLVVVHNADNAEIVLDVAAIEDAANWSVVVDGNYAGTTAILGSDVVIENGKVTVPANSSAVIAK